MPVTQPSRIKSTSEENFLGDVLYFSDGQQVVEAAAYSHQPCVPHRNFLRLRVLFTRLQRNRPGNKYRALLPVLCKKIVTLTPDKNFDKWSFANTTEHCRFCMKVQMAKKRDFSLLKKANNGLLKNMSVKRTNGHATPRKG